MLMRRLYNNKTSYIYNLQPIYTFEYNTLYKKIKTCYVTKVVCNMYKLLYTMIKLFFSTKIHIFSTSINGLELGFRV